ncbi:hypothetical protein PIB30_052529 [Stylosanthes scabra]|uniref:Uncharacterized protein n=1 Tax=Stylosanthes scabra TaxID=79078 RepID=A0ABU6ZH06_9FABA|nr:hypothetical protein [Stylosanthes scabra]
MTPSFSMLSLVVGREDPREIKQGKELKRLHIIVEDIEKNKVNCVLFDQHVDSILPYLDEERVEPLIVVLHYFRATRWNGDCLYGSHAGEWGAGAISRTSHVSSHTVVSAVGELSQPNAQVMKIEDVIKCTEEYKPWIATSIMDVNNGIHHWYYTHAQAVGRRWNVHQWADMSAQIEKCGQSGDKPRSKYKLEVMVYDGTACLNLLMWDMQVIQLCGKRADQVAKEILNHYCVILSWWNYVNYNDVKSWCIG